MEVRSTIVIAALLLTAADAMAQDQFVPRSGSALPAIVFVHGSGAEGRWASRFLAMHVARPS